MMMMMMMMMMMIRSWIFKKTRISKRHTEKQTSESVKTNQNGFFIAMPTLSLVVSSTTVFIYSKIENQFPEKGKKMCETGRL